MELMLNGCKRQHNSNEEQHSNSAGKSECTFEISIDRSSIFVSGVDRVMSARFTLTGYAKSMSEQSSNNDAVNVSSSSAEVSAELFDSNFNQSANHTDSVNYIHIDMTSEALRGKKLFALNGLIRCTFLPFDPIQSDTVSDSSPVSSSPPSPRRGNVGNSSTEPSGIISSSFSTPSFSHSLPSAPPDSSYQPKLSEGSQRPFQAQDKLPLILKATIALDPFALYQQFGRFP